MCSPFSLSLSVSLSLSLSLSHNHKTNSTQAIRMGRDLLYVEYVRRREWTGVEKCGNNMCLQYFEN
jgi:hypothetical protein